MFTTGDIDRGDEGDKLAIKEPALFSREFAEVAVYIDGIHGLILHLRKQPLLVLASSRVLTCATIEPKSREEGAAIGSRWSHILLLLMVLLVSLTFVSGCQLIDAEATSSSLKTSSSLSELSSHLHKSVIAVPEIEALLECDKPENYIPLSTP
ncbi:MAG: hypothetical protein FWD41_03685 [Actinomycetia bacterium]|nr:hypothetical protein [Actinomycetes bacterium]